MDSNTLLDVGSRIAARLSEIDGVLAIAQGGSAASGTSDALSDVDLYVYSQGSLTADDRRALVLALSVPGSAIIGHVWFEPGDVWHDPDSGLLCDVMYRTTGWAEAEIDRVLVRHEAQMGYSTAHLYNLAESVIHFDPENWLHRVQERASSGYPSALAEAIVRYNLPLLSGFPFSFRNQLEKGLQRRDRVASVRVLDRFLSSYFDVLFAVNRQFHPGEKRLAELAGRLEIAAPDPADLEALIASVTAGTERDALRAVDRLITQLQAAL